MQAKRRNGISIVHDGNRSRTMDEMPKDNAQSHESEIAHTAKRSEPKRPERPDRDPVLAVRGVFVRYGLFRSD
jgi:hypothetical protein